MLRLLDTSSFPPRWHCGDWSAALGWLHIVSDLTIFGAYTAIPLLLVVFVRKRPDTPFPRIFWLFVAFIFSCGTVHLIEAIIFWEPVYRLSGVVKAVTAAVSVATAVALVPVLPRALVLPNVHQTAAHLASIISTSGDAILSKSLEGEVLTWNPGAERMYGYRADEIVGRSVSILVPPDREREIGNIMSRIRRGERVGHFDTERVDRDGRRISVSLSVSPIFDESGAVVGASSIGRDISVQKQTERTLKATARRLRRANQRLRLLADHDPLTGVLNRRGLEAALGMEVERTRRHGSRGAAILIDCDDFKQVNDRFGHDAGDEVLREIAERIQDASREPDRVARIGGDEFMILAPDTRVAEAVLLAQRIRLAVAAAPVELPGGEIFVQISCGVEPIDARDSSLDDLVARTSSTLAQSKYMGKNRVTAGFGEPTIDFDPSTARLEAVAQPIIEISSGRRVGIEFLIRGPIGTFRMPDDLFRTSRERGTLTAVDLNCLERCAALGGRVEDTLDLHINVFPSTVLETDLAELERRMDGLVHMRRMCIELNEVMLVGDPVALAPKTRALRERTGCRVAIDDVGFGRSSLEALIVLEPDIIKIDRAYVNGAHRDTAQRRHLERLLHVGRALNARIIAEGVETEEDRQVLADLGVEYGQGYLWGRPAPLDIPS